MYALAQLRQQLSIQIGVDPDRDWNGGVLKPSRSDTTSSVVPKEAWYRSVWVGRLVILVLVLLLGWVVGMLLSYFTRSLGLGPLDRVIGLFFGIVRGMVLVGLVVIGGELLHMNGEDWWDRSKLVPYGETIGDWLRAMVGEKGEPWAKLERLTGVKVRPK